MRIWPFNWSKRSVDDAPTDFGTLAEPGEELLSLFGGGSITAAGIQVGPKEALRVPAVACAVRAIAEGVAQLPCHIYRRSTRERATDHPAYGLLHDDFNDWTPAFEGKRQLQVDALMHDKGGIAFVNRVRGTPKEIIRLDPAKVTVKAGDDGEPIYTVESKAGGTRELAREDVIHIRSIGLDGVTGCAPGTLAREAIGLALAQEAHAARLFGRGGRPSGILKFDGKLTAGAAARIKASWGAAFGGRASGGTAVLEGGADYKPVTLTSVDLQFLELRGFQVAEIARAFRVPPTLLMDLSKATLNNVGELGQQFVTYSLMPHLKTWEGALRRALLTKDERAEGDLYIEFLPDEFLRADIAKRADAYAKMITARVLNPNEARAAENRPPYAGGDAFENPNTTPGAAAKPKDPTE